jgi:hypothetical protein
MYLELNLAAPKPVAVAMEAVYLSRSSIRPSNQKLYAGPSGSVNSGNEVIQGWEVLLKFSRLWCYIPLLATLMSLCNGPVQYGL